MVVIELIGKSPLGARCKHAYFELSFDQCIDMINRLVRGGWLLEQIQLYELDRQPINLPVEAFDGQPITDTFRRLAAQWQEALS
ncbi:MAG: hypothetical protein EOO61_03920 [Hymenobacter sp.]|nr:MAG: hypothetical protein EOO61_03920 [Hymenobacter sp.]